MGKRTTEYMTKIAVHTNRMETHLERFQITTNDFKKLTEQGIELQQRQIAVIKKYDEVDSRNLSDIERDKTYMKLKTVEEKWVPLAHRLLDKLTTSKKAIQKEVKDADKLLVDFEKFVVMKNKKPIWKKTSVGKAKKFIKEKRQLLAEIKL